MKNVKSENDRNKLIPSMWSTMLVGLSPYEAVDVFAECGFSAMELSRDHFLSLYNSPDRKKEAERFKDFVVGRGFFVGQGHLPMKDVVFGDKSAVDSTKRYIEYFLDLGMENVVLHVGRGVQPPPADMPYDELLARRAAAVSDLAPLVRGTDTFLCLENLRANMRTSKEISDVLAAVDFPNLAVCYDTGHLNQNRDKESQADFVRALGGKIRAIHINDNDSSYEQHLYPYSMALDIPAHNCRRVDFDEVLKSLKDVGYKGMFNFELPGENVAPLPVLKAKIRYAKELADIMLARMENL